jgi:hypothetical protein
MRDCAAQGREDRGVCRRVEANPKLADRLKLGRFGARGRGQRAPHDLGGREEALRPLTLAVEGRLGHPCAVLEAESKAARQCAELSKQAHEQTHRLPQQISPQMPLRISRRAGAGPLSSSREKYETSLRIDERMAARCEGRNAFAVGRCA